MTKYERNLCSLIAAAVMLQTAACSTIDWSPANGPETALSAERAVLQSIPSTDDGYVVGLAFSGGGTRAAAFSYGVLDGLRTWREPSINGSMLDHVRFVSSVSGGSVTAAYYGLFHGQIFQDFERKFLYADAEEDLTTTFGPTVVRAALSGGVNDQTRLPRWFERNLFGQASVDDLLSRSPRVLLNATDVYNRVPFAFNYDTFRAICSDPSTVLVADAVAASAAVPIAFVPVVLQVYKDQCKAPLPNWVVQANVDPRVPPSLRALASAHKRYRTDPDVNFLKLADGGITDNLALSSLSTALDSFKYSSKASGDLVRIRRVLIISVDSGQEQTATWLRTASGSSGIELASAALDTSLDALARTNLDLFQRQLQQWKQDAIAARCSMDRKVVSKVPGVRPDWRCDDLEVEVRHVSFEDLGEARARQLSLVKTAFALPSEQVSAVIQAGRDVVKLLPQKRDGIRMSVR